MKLGYLLNVGGLLGVILLPQGANFPLYKLIEDESFAAHGPLEVVVIHAPGNMPYSYVGHRMAFLEPRNLRWTFDPPATDLEARYSRGETFLALVDIPPPAPGARCLDTQSMCFCVVHLAAVGVALQLLPVAEPVSMGGNSTAAMAPPRMERSASILCLLGYRSR